MDKKERKRESKHRSLNDQINIQKRNISTKEEKMGRRYEGREEG